ncbi:hypothetical protein CBR_g17746 [Chara braunii]|uniref:Phosphate transporter n=1 Tax=Chara braunii TaxID=69332 RepID=A0A388KVE9_CHABU|nr:hypothetical protein CBR_g17746 [Chara braunii]|eukprot:GBG74036.1 hypothetical protein CBR_g17746 [Chara braunii]
MAAEYALDHMYYWIYILAIILSFFMAWGIGANDVANSFGTSVGSGAITLKQAVVIAWVFEFSGAFFMGGRVADTMKGGIVDPKIFLIPDGKFDKDGAALLMWGMFIAIAVAGVWIALATFYGMPISTTHSIIGSFIGFSMVAKGANSVFWYKEDPKSDLKVGGFAAIVVSWVLTPLIAGMASVILFTFTKIVILRPQNSERRTLIAMPIYYGLTAFIITFFIVYKGSARLKLSDIGNVKATWIAIVVAVGVASLAALIGIPLAKKRLANLEDRKQRKAEQKARDKALIAKVAGDGAKERDEEKGGQGSKTPASRVDDGARPSMTAWQRVKAWYLLVESKTISHDLEFTEHTLDLHSRAEMFDERSEELFSFLQVLTACAAAFAHGSNDTANAIGPLSAVQNIYQGDAVKFDAKKGKLTLPKLEVESWQLAMGGFALGLGFAVWGWRMVRNLGGAVTKMTPSRGFTAELCAAMTVVVASRFGMPISTTQTLVGATVGVGASDDWRNVDWWLFGQFVISWVVTILFAGFGTAAVFAFTIFSPSVQV